ncbi:FtsX-like permease family protein [Spirosoma sp. HMF4905]|uniref:FtsX-like permease family protein n=2 Tax=Spirosoma arboris TaxID=2682092 RepID=A0A7K1SJN8_9BACT|nr:FtsX-like permease family protein [Spirosoma arboris]
MLRNYLKIALRSFWRNKSFSLINILGLALGLTCSLLIFLWVRDELSVDRYHANGPQLYRVMWRQLSDGKRMAMPSTPALMAQELPKKFPEIVRATGYTNRHAHMAFSVGNKINKEVGDWVGADWFKLFSVPLLIGSPETALKSPNGLAISRKLAESYFGSPQAAMGKSIRIENKDDYQVTAVFENLPPNTSQNYDFLLPWEDFMKRQHTWASGWGNPSPWTFVQLRPDADVPAFEAKIKHFLRSYLGINSKNASQFDVELFLQPFNDIYLHDQTENGEISGGRIDYVRLLSIVAVFMLLIACINFMNLSTARSAKRAKEVGIRKVVGAERSWLITQFLGETLLLTIVAVLVALLLVGLLLPSFNQLSGKQVAMPFAEVDFWVALGCIVAITGIVAGSYPALFLSSLQPVRVLKGLLTIRPGATRFREGLVVFQFVISMLLIIGTFVVYRQVNFIQTKNLGFDRENLIYVPMEGDLLPKYATLKQELQRMPGIQGVSRMDYQPGDIGSNTTWVDWPGKDPTVSVGFAQVSVGYDMDKVLNMKLMGGRYFSRAFSTDSGGYVINEQAAQRIGYKNRTAGSPVGQPLTFWGKPGKIIGVVQDFHFQSLHEPIKPIIMWFGENNTYGNLMVRTQPGQTKQALASLETLCKQLNPKIPFTYSFADQEFQRMYKSEQIVGTLINYFAFLAIFIACLGLFGLASFTAEQRTKEIGVRKVLGASVASIVGLLSNEFLRLVVIAIVIATPISWWAMDKWLQGFAYKEELSWWIFGLAGLLAILIALLTVSFQSVKAALMNPVTSLRSE